MSAQTIKHLFKSNSLRLPLTMLLLWLPYCLWAAVNEPSVQYQFDPQGNPTQTTDGLGHATVQQFDALNRLIKQIQPNPTGNGGLGEIHYQYDAQDNATRITDPRGLQTDSGFDGLNNLHQRDAPDTGSSLYSHDQAGNLISRTDALNIETRYRYDAANRLTQIQYIKANTTTETASLQYDQGVNGLGRLTSIRNNSGQINAWTYDSQGRTLSQQQTTGTLSFNQQIQYDPQGRPQTLTYPSGRVIDLGYDAAGRVNQIKVDGVPAVTGIAWQAFGGVQGWTWAGSGKTYARGYDLSGRITSTTLGDTTRKLEWDAANRIVQSSDYQLAAPLTPVNQQTYGYDNLDRLTQYPINANTPQNDSYDLDGNRSRRTANGNAIDYTYAANSNRLTNASSRNYSYDAAGQLLNDGVTQYSYNNAGRLNQTVNSRGRVWYYYNGLGRRVGKWVSNPLDLAGDADHDGKITGIDYRKTAAIISGLNALDLAADCNRDNSITQADLTCIQAKYGSVNQYQLAFTHFVYDAAGHLIGEYRQNGTPIQETVYLGDIPVLTLRPGMAGPIIYTIDTDHLNTPRVIKNQAGTVVWRWDFADPFGVAQPNGNPSGLGTFTYNLRFPGQYYDQETGLHYNMARYYDPVTPRYLQADPIGLAGGVNGYAYVSNNPLRYIDSLGLEQFGIGIEPPSSTAISHGILDPSVDPGHTFAYLATDSGNILSVFSMGPTSPVAFNKSSFLDGSLGGVSDWGLSGKISTYKWKISGDQFQQCKSAFDAKKANPGNYSPTNQCTSSAISLANQCGINVPNGVSPVAVPSIPLVFEGYNANLPNPYGLQQQLNQTMSPTVVPATKFPGGQ